ncbi:MAG: hypothetical protein HYT87_03555 [Nitrospirae bacterium]|nr:hypothetical protein [Nitrospirota bacterium]
MVGAGFSLRVLRYPHDFSDALKLVLFILSICLPVLSCSGQANDSVWRPFFLLYETRPAVGLGQLTIWNREEDSSVLSLVRVHSPDSSTPRFIADVSLPEPLRTGWFSPDGGYFHGLSASGRMHTIRAATGDIESEVNLGLSNPVEAKYGAARSIVFVARFSPPQMVLLSYEDFSHIGAYDLPGRPGRLVLDETNERLFVSIPEKDRVLVLGVDPLREIVSLDFAAGSKPTGMMVGESGSVYVSRPGSGAVTRISSNLTSRVDFAVSGAPQAVSVGLTKKGPRLVLANPVAHGFQILTPDLLSTEAKLTLGAESAPFEIFEAPDPHFTLFLSRDPAEIGWIDHWLGRIAFVTSLPDVPLALLLQPPVPPDPSRF